MKAHFIQALDGLNQMISEVAAQVEAAILLSVNAVEKLHSADAAKVKAGDDAIDDAEIKIEEECLKILALYQPVAGDLRQVVTILKINNEIERAGDLATSIAERVPDMVNYADSPIEKIDFSCMVNRACEMFRKSLDSMTYHDVVLATEVIRMDNAVDDIHRENYSRVRDMILKHPNESGYYMDCLTVSRCLERIADIATNICEDVIYLESGNIVRHKHEGRRHGK